jgi:hypothetical protein
LISHVLGSSLTHHKVFVVLHGEETIFSIRLDVAVGLTVHGFGTKSSADQEDFLISMLSKALGLIEKL